MERQKSSTERASPTGSAQCLIFCRRRSYIPAAVPVSIMSSDVDTTVKTTSAILAFVSLNMASQIVPAYIRKPAEKVFSPKSVIISTKRCISVYCKDFITQNVHPADK